MAHFKHRSARAAARCRTVRAYAIVVEISIATEIDVASDDTEDIEGKEMELLNPQFHVLLLNTRPIEICRFQR